MRHQARKLTAAAALSMSSVLLTAVSAPAATFNVLHTFTGGSDGGNPVDGVTIDKFGNLYGTAASGGSGYGTAYELKPAGSGWTFQVLHTFTAGADGAAPGARLIPGPGGRLYGTTTQGASGGGTVFDLGALKKSPKENALFTFTGGNGYQASDGDLSFDKHGDIYGTTSYGGTYNGGALFKLTKSKGGYSETLLHSFGSGTDGSVPVSGVIFDAQGNMYGSTSAGGTGGYGTIYEVSPTGQETILWNFQAQSDGMTPYAGLQLDASGNLYGAATNGGVNGGGTIFELSQSNGSWNLTPIYSTPGWGVSGPYRTPYLDANGNIFGTTHCDGAYSAGSIYELTRSGSTWNYTALHDFTGGSDGAYVFAPPVFDSKGNIYGTTQVGGSGYGVVWEVSP